MGTTPRQTALRAPRPRSPFRASHPLAWPAAVCGLVALLALVPIPSHAQATGAVSGRVFDSESGDPLSGVAVIAEAAPSAGEEPAQQVARTDADGAFHFDALPAGPWVLRFSKAGFRPAELSDLTVKAGQTTRADFPLSPAPAETADQILELDAFVVEASTVDEGGELLQLRLDADQFLNTFSAEEFSKFAASDVAEALRRVSGVNVVEGQFAVIRGLEDRYNSTLYNSAPIPSPDPDRQSVQLDLFPSDIVSNLLVSKTFVSDLPSNSSGGSIDILTHDYPETFEIKISGGSGFETEALDRFLQLNRGSPVGSEASASHVIEREAGGSIGGRTELFGRELRFKGLFNYEVDFRTAEGFQEAREPERSVFERRPSPGRFEKSGGLALGELSLSGGRFDLTESQRSQQDTGYAGFGFDLDEAGKHRIDSSFFYTDKQDETVQLRENGFIPGFDYEPLAERQRAGFSIRPEFFEGFATLSSWIARSVRPGPLDFPEDGPLFFTSFLESRSFLRERDLTVYQVNGEHEIDLLDGLQLSWAANRAETTQQETSLGLRFFVEPDDPDEIPTEFPVSVDDVPGQFAANTDFFESSNSIEETQRFGRIDAEYELDAGERVRVTLSAGGWFEDADRTVESSFREGVNVDGGTQFALLADTPEELGQRFVEETGGNVRNSTNEAKREITAWSVGSKTTLFEKLDLLAGVRVEDIFIESLNDPFTGSTIPGDGAPVIFPSSFLLFDRRDNPNRSFERPNAPPGTAFNDEILGIEVPIDPETGIVDLLTREDIESLVNGTIDEKKVLPSFGFALRPIEGLVLRGAYSKTVARPSFRELGYFVSVEPGSDDRIVGNPQLQLSDVESFDVRAEYAWGSFGDLVAVSLFYKEIEDPIESIVVRDPSNFEGSSTALFRTFFNNPNPGKIRGIEAEARKNLGFLGLDFLQYLSVGGNFSYIDAEVERTEAELARSETFFGVADGDPLRFSRLKPKRRLFGQPEWIANADVSFDQPEWGTRVTLAFFAISDILQAAGSANLDPDGRVSAFTIDRFSDSFDQLDFIASQRFRLASLPGEFTFKTSIKNLTNSSRGIIFDPDQTKQEISERKFKIGRDFSFSLSYRYEF